MDYPKRKSIRLQNYDYSQNGAYFITICTYHSFPYFGNVGSMTIAKQMIVFALKKTLAQYDGITCPKMVIMPNHLHAVILIDRAHTGCAPTLMDVIQSFKRYSTVLYCRLVHQGLAKPFDKHLWQRSFYDRVIRDDEEYTAVLKYLDENPLKWTITHLNEC